MGVDVEELRIEYFKAEKTLKTKKNCDKSNNLLNQYTNITYFIPYC